MRALILLTILGGCRHDRLETSMTPANPSDDEAWGDIGDGHVAAGNTRDALDSYVRALQLDPGDGEWQRKVVEFGGSDALIHEADRLLPDSSTDDEAIGDRAGAWMTAGRTDEACEMYRRALAIDPTDSEWTARVQECGGDTSGGVPYGAVFEPVHEDYRDEGTVLGYSPGSEMYAEVLGTLTGEVGGISEPLTATVPEPEVLPPELFVAKTPLVTAVDEVRAGRTIEARNAVWSALQQDPWSVDARLLWTLLTGDSQPALLEKLVVLRPNDARLWGELGDARLTVGKKPDAIVAWQKAAALDPYQAAWGLRIEMARATTAPKK